jgi:hypothetical protein
MMKRNIGLILITLMTLVGCGSNQEPKLSVEAKNTIEKVSQIYGEKNPKIVQINTTKEETTKKTMYIVFLKGDFQKEGQKSQNLEFSMTEDGKKVWAITSDSWQENEVNLINLNKIISIKENDVREIRTWGKDTGESGRGVLLDKAKSAKIIKWVNNAKIIGYANLPLDMKCPQSQIIIYFTNKKTLPMQIFLFGGNLIIDSYIAVQKDLTEFLRQNER